MIVLSVFILTSGCLLFEPGVDQKPSQDQQLPQWAPILTAYGIIAFQFDIHPTILTVLVDMKNRKQLPSAVFGGFAG